MGKLPELEPNNVNRISYGTDIKGNIKTNGDIRIDGSLEGNLTTAGKIVVGETGKIKGEIKCKNSDIEGQLIGKIVVEELLALKRTSSINGDIVTDKLAIEPGATFTGKCEMSTDNNEIKPEPEQKPQQPEKDAK
ncbi:polymer-forming cytoskeletal protein [Bacteroidota bacterium]